MVAGASGRCCECKAWPQYDGDVSGPCPRPPPGYTPAAGRRRVSKTCRARINTSMECLVLPPASSPVRGAYSQKCRWCDPYALLSNQELRPPRAQCRMLTKINTIYMSRSGRIEYEKDIMNTRNRVRAKIARSSIHTTLWNSITCGARKNSH